MIDTHAHLQSFDDFEEVLERAEHVGVDRCILPGDTLATSKMAVEIADRYRNIFAAVGLHPHEAKDLDAAALETLKGLAQSKNVVAIGEIGLDFYYDHSPRDVQKEAFKAQLELAKELDLPVIIHDRDAHDEVLEVIGESGHRSGVFHCFSGDGELALRVVELGFYVSFAGTVTFKKAEAIAQAAVAVPDDRLLIETDSPYLSPVPLRGKRNEPAHLPHIAQKIAAIRGTDIDEIVRLVDANADRLFRFPDHR